MKYKTTYQFRWVLVLALFSLIYLSNLILIKLPFVSTSFPQKVSTEGLFTFLLSFLPKLNFEMKIYNIQTIVVWASGIILGPKMGFITLILYLLIGLIGFPIFASGGGVDYYKEPTFGYLISLPLNAFLSGWLYEKDKKFSSAFVPIILTHLCGIIYLLIFNQNFLDVAWHLSFSMISYDLIFTLLLLPVMPIVLFFLKEMFIQEVPARDLSLYETKR